MQNASEAIEYVRSVNDHGETYNLVMRMFLNTDCTDYTDNS